MLTHRGLVFEWDVGGVPVQIVLELNVPRVKMFEIVSRIMVREEGIEDKRRPDNDLSGAGRSNNGIDWGS